MKREVMVHVCRGDDVLVLRRTDHGYWHTVAGGVDSGEDWQAAAVRELQEETGLTAVEVRRLAEFSYTAEAWENRSGAPVDVHAFVASAPAAWEPVLNEEHDTYRWCSREEAESLLYWPEPKELLRAI